MPLNLQKNLPAVELLKKEHIFVMDSLRASEQDIRPLRELDATEDHDGDGPCSPPEQYPLASGARLYEDKRPYSQEHADRAYEGIL